MPPLVLLVEDDEHNLDIYQTYLQWLDYRISTSPLTQAKSADW